MTKNINLDFLSNLSGDEGYAQCRGIDYRFLSHLSGDEVLLDDEHGFT